jgi:hypothetical protein
MARQMRVGRGYEGRAISGALISARRTRSEEEQVMAEPEEIRRQLSAAHADALRVGDSPLRADRLADSLARIASSIDAAVGLSDDVKARLHGALADAERVLRRDDDGREAARHLQAALRLVADRPRPASPFLDD